MAQSMDKITIRLMTIEDYDQVYALWIRTPGMGLNSVDDTREGIARYLARNPRTCFVAEAGGEIVGVILCGNDGRRGMIHHTDVSAQWQRRGVGTALWGAAATALKREGITKAWLVVFRRNEKGNAFWERVGFERRDDLHFMGATLDETLVRIDT
jgi:N-acetylglutamate synthase